MSTQVSKKLFASLLFMGFLLAACGDNENLSQSNKSDISTPAGKSIQLRLDWQNAPTTWPADIQNDLGYRIRLDHVYLVNLYVELKPCNPKDLQPFIQQTPTQSWLPLISNAYAAHPMSAPTRIVLDAAEWVDQGSTVSDFTLDIPAIRYCFVHFLMARATENTQATAGREHQPNTSLAVKGQYQAPHDTQWQTFEIQTSVAYGKLFNTDLIPPDTSTIQIMLVRNFRTMFDSVDFTNQTSRKIGINIMRNLVEKMTVTATPLTE